MKQIKRRICRLSKDDTKYVKCVSYLKYNETNPKELRSSSLICVRVENYRRLRGPETIVHRIGLNT